MAFYLKYRPQKISDFDLVDIRKSITKVLRSDNMPHALLFAGPRGVGKTSMARLVAKSLNCPHCKGIEPCAECSVCRAIEQGSFLDVLEIDAASNRGIDDIRQLKEKIGLAAAKGEYKVYIIDEVHMLTTEAFNALLKTLEEPPEQVIFILCTTNPEKIPETILSRCMRFNFKKATSAEVVGALKKVVSGEELEIDEKSLKLIAGAVDGSFRDAQKLLEELSYEEGKITKQQVEKVLGQGQNLQPRHLLEKIFAADFKGAMAEVARLEESGVDLQGFLKRILQNLREMLHTVWGVSQAKELPANEAELLRLVALFDQAARQVKYTSLPILPLELAVARAIEKKDKENPPEKGGGQKKATTSRSSKKQSKKKAPKNKKKAKKQKKPAKKARKKVNSGNGGSVSSQQWQSILTKVVPNNRSLGAFLKSAQPAGLKDDRLILKVFYRFHKECLEREGNRRLVEDAAQDVLGCRVRLFCRFSKEKPAPRSKPANKTVAKEKEDGNIYEVAKDIFGGEKDG